MKHITLGDRILAWRKAFQASRGLEPPRIKVDLRYLSLAGTKKKEIT